MQWTVYFLILCLGVEVAKLNAPNSGAESMFLGYAKVYNTLATIKLKYDLNPLIEGFQRARSLYSRLDTKKVIKVSNDSFMGDFLRDLAVSQNQINKDFEFFLGAIGAFNINVFPSRRKRGLVDMAGDISHYLFGLATDQELIPLRDTLTDNNNKLAQLAFKAQAPRVILNASLDDLSALSHAHKGLTNKLNEIIKYTGSISEEISAVDIKINLLNKYLNLQNRYSLFIHNIKNFLSSIEKIKNSRSDTYLLNDIVLGKIQADLHAKGVSLVGNLQYNTDTTLLRKLLLINLAVSIEKIDLW